MITGIAFLLLFLVYSAAGFFILPPYARRLAEDTLSSQLGRRVTIASVSLNPYTLVAVVRGFEIREADGSMTFLSFGSLLVDMQLSSIVRNGLVIREVRLEQPRLNLVRTAANAYNFSDILARVRPSGDTGAERKPGSPLRFSVNNIQLVDGDITFDDRPDGAAHRITRINLAIPFLSNFPAHIDSFIKPSFSALVNGAPVNIRGDSKVFADSLESSLDIDLKDLDIPAYLAYVPRTFRVTVPSGRLDISMKATYRQYADRAPLLVLGGEVRIRDLRTAIPGFPGDFLRVPLLAVKDVSVDLQDRTIGIGAITSAGGVLAISRTGDGRLNAAVITAGRLPADQPAEEAPPSDAAPWTVKLDALGVDGYRVNVADRSLAGPFEMTIDEITCKVRDLSTGENARGTMALSLRVERKGRVSADGAFTVRPPSVDLAVNVQGLPLSPVQPFLAGRAPVILSSGAVSVNGRVSALRPAGGALATSFTGSLGVNGLSLLDAVSEEDLAGWDALSLDGIDIRYEPLFVRIREVTLAGLSLNIIVNADRSLNLRQAVSTPTATAGDAAPALQAAETQPAQPRTIAVDTIRIRDGSVAFEDNSISPRFSADLSGITGRISGVSSQADATGEVELRGLYDDTAPLEITGKVNPFRESLFVDLHASFKDMDLPSLSPYAGRYAGYLIEKGKLSFRLDYLIRKTALEAGNSIFLDQFTFGGRVDSPEATSLPVRLAVSLLKDQNGQISLDIPVSGELSDPSFSVSGVVLKVIVNLLVKAATSPFALLSALVGGDAQLDHAEFDPGSALLSEASRKKLDLLAKALGERPALRMELTGRTDPDKDREGMRQGLLLRKVKAQKVKELAGPGGDSPGLESVVVTAEEYPRLLKRAYQKEKIPKPRNFLGMAKDLPVPEMEALMLANLKVTDDDLRVLAEKRTRAVMAYLLQTKQVTQERLFIVEAGAAAAEKKDGVAGSRVDFALK